MVSIPFSKNKHYLTGIDWILHGFDAMNLGNNHIRDCGDPGVRQSALLLRAVGMIPFGGGMTGSTGSV